MEDTIPDEHQLIEGFAYVALAFKAEANPPAQDNDMPQAICAPNRCDQCNRDDRNPHSGRRAHALQRDEAAMSKGEYADRKS